MFDFTTHDIRYPVAGQTVTLKSELVPDPISGSIGNRYRTRLTSAPQASALELYTEAKQNYLPDNKITPDVGGLYKIEFCEETDAVVVPHHSTDFGGLSVKGVVQNTLVSTYTMDLYVGEYVSRRVGLPPDECTLGVWAFSNVPNKFSMGLHGVLSAYADQTHAPRLHEHTSDNAAIAVRDASVMSALRDIGGMTPGWEAYGDRFHIEQITIVPWASIIDSAILDTFAYTVLAMNSHITSAHIDIHAAADAGNQVTAADADLTEPLQRTLLNDILAQVSAHAAIGAGVVHHDADTIFAGDVIGLAPLGVGSSLEDRIDFCNTLFAAVDGHMARTFLTTAHTTYAHDHSGDTHLSYATYYPVDTVEGVRDAANHMKAIYNAHRSNALLVVGAGYHAIAGDFHCMFDDAYPTDKAGLAVAVRTALSIWNSHVTNVEADSGTTIVYHTEADHGSRTDTIPGPTDYESAVIALEALRYCIGTHVSRGSPVHSAARPGGWKVWPRGIEAIHHAFRAAVENKVGCNARNVLTPTIKLVQVGGWKLGGTPPSDQTDSSVNPGVGIPVHD